jgi:hypothetical protein
MKLTSVEEAVSWIGELTGVWLESDGFDFCGVSSLFIAQFEQCLLSIRDVKRHNQQDASRYYLLLPNSSNSQSASGPESGAQTQNPYRRGQLSSLGVMEERNLCQGTVLLVAAVRIPETEFKVPSDSA